MQEFRVVEVETEGLCEKHTENGYCYIHPFGHREYLICPNCLMYSADPFSLSQLNVIKI